MNAVVEEARLWLGTPYRHQGAVRGAGCDCLGLIRGIWRARYGAEPEAVPPYSRDWAERGGEEHLWRAALRHMAPGTGAAGDVLLFRMRRGAVAKHLGIQSDDGRFIHAMSGQGVVESALTPLWRARIVARFSFPLNGLGS
ncbi:putative endopeptidase Spr precursor [Tritonibacter multivorans]|uniref:Putative endopeptidase Spr n=1 Tax=Tritonibacter multivorans TaxID=928856 RepID=A0A0N7M0X0_9RHOB|nr:NlpC/P60 family protein [Tritonibacter multivorans]MDA7420420.1 NlpC/P60 family protein [Tritonibacter multivorans]CUH81641.1 putative endopeptidase Spr precursor [Tritonibacter multivorans]SFC39967.1 putative phage cell wall peptidase, NlpC/P60 family [Tritonibacter multivorans]